MQARYQVKTLASFFTFAFVKRVCLATTWSLRFSMRGCRTDVINLLDQALASDVGGITIEDFGFRSWK